MTERSKRPVPMWRVLRAWRKELGFSIRRVSELLDIPYSTVHRREQSRSERQRIKDRADAKEYWKNNKEDLLYKKKVYLSSKPLQRLRYLLKNAVNRGRHRNLLCDDIDYLMTFLEKEPTHCACCGKTINYALAPDKFNEKNPDFPSIDRIDNTKGYVADNIGIVCFSCNTLKGKASIIQLEKMLNYVKSSPSLQKRQSQ